MTVAHECYEKVRTTEEVKENEIICLLSRISYSPSYYDESSAISHGWRVIGEEAGGPKAEKSTKSMKYYEMSQTKQ